jgi:cytochrome c-type biogenesis protein CcmH/NrfG
MGAEPMTSQPANPQPSLLRYRRLPAALTLLMVFVIGGAVLYSRVRASRAAAGVTKASWTLDQLEMAIASDAPDAQTWYWYGRRLMEQNRYVHAAAAYKKALELDPANREARFQCALALAQGGSDDEMYAFLKDLVLADPKLALSLFDRPELHHVMGDPRFQSLSHDARFQSID